MPHLATTREHCFAVKDPIAIVARDDDPSLLFALVGNSLIFMTSDLGDVSLDWLTICWLGIKSQPRITGGRHEAPLVGARILWQQLPVRRNDRVVVRAIFRRFCLSGHRQDQHYSR